ncbi:MAG TPA: ATP-binding protein [Burkholderiaceae bacterium]|nr:ATP-binding protein [Burkholderiaceae bacterium]
MTSMRQAIPPPATRRASLVTTVAILGAESTGKSDLSMALAEHYRRQDITVAVVPEYLRTFVECKGDVPVEPEQRHIARMQRAAELCARRTVAQQGGGLVLCDTTPLMTAIYSRFCFQTCDAETARLAALHDYPLTLLTLPDIPWVADGLQRASEDVRTAVHRRVLAACRVRGIDYVRIGGSPAERLMQAVLQIDRVMRLV